jgi:hypothetical protein
MRRFSELLPIMLLACSPAPSPFSEGSAEPAPTTHRPILPPDEFAADAGGVDAWAMISSECADALHATRCEVGAYLILPNTCIGEDCRDLCAATSCGASGTQVATSCNWLPLGDGGANTVQCYFDSGYGCGAGRRPCGLRPRRTAAAHDLGGWFAESARMEAASVDAFFVLVGELGAHAAPDELVRRALAAAADEERHTRVMLSLMDRYGGTYEPPRVDVREDRSLEAIALENAVEGCIEESFAALVAAWQAEHATDTVVRAAMKQIAEDEARHADLAWDVHEWIMARLDPAGRARVHLAMDRAARRTRELPSDPRAGIPSARVIRTLTESLDRLLWVA